ncbi:large ribosomal subunit protein mL62 isoform X2 [Parasteatoda tepidariorum]|uniref:large ribosomal subunit protein mL62 isoform X1 n=1 Tax=Parasteatoda tepidariorum TaxID=114398 RepID=UPI001C717D2E|nr:peptidyl-tRNA hydrolase ICT1, mitochondrial isoform X1 [Parasteatoda tepidariorum]XP_042906772.1 peptidyl-tRNA hydrolase ICT1, mitochondrial isoform X2 [Parasteatoda tepidariorum]
MLVSGLLSRLRVSSSINPLLFRGFKSEYSLDKIYPESSLNLSKPKEIKSSEDKFSGFVPIEKLQITYSKSSGPGGQNVNKNNTKVEVRFHVATASWIPEIAREKLLKLHHNNITKDGFMVLKSDKTRMQTLNLADCMDKLRCYIREAEKPPPEVLPETLALQKKRQEKAAAERLREKRIGTSIRRMKKEGLHNMEY